MCTIIHLDLFTVHLTRRKAKLDNYTLQMKYTKRTKSKKRKEGQTHFQVFHLLHKVTLEKKTRHPPTKSGWRVR